MATSPPQKYIPNTLPLRKVANPTEHLITSLTYIIKTYPPTDLSWNTEAPVGGLYIGPSAFAYFFLHLSHTHPTLQISSQPALYWAKAYISHPIPSGETSSSLCGIVNKPLCHLAVSAAITKDLSFVHEFLKLIEDNSVISDDGYDEWCYGRSGTLYLLRLIRHWLPSSESLLNPVITKLTECILSHGPPYIFNKRQYLGCGHGELGILLQVLLTTPSLSTSPKITSMLSSLLDLQLPNGTWVASPETPERELVQFCHGAPGFAIALTSLLPLFKDSNPELAARMETAIVKAREATWERGLLIKEPNLCHGILGNAFAFGPGEKRDHFLSYCTSDVVGKGYAVREGDGEELMSWENCDYEMPYSLGFGALGGHHPWGWFAREWEGNVIFSFNDI